MITTPMAAARMVLNRAEASMPRRLSPVNSRKNSTANTANGIAGNAATAALLHQRCRSSD